MMSLIGKIMLSKEIKGWSWDASVLAGKSIDQR